MSYTLIPIYDAQSYKKIADVYLTDYEIDRLRGYGVMEIPVVPKLPTLSAGFQDAPSEMIKTVRVTFQLGNDLHNWRHPIVLARGDPEVIERFVEERKADCWYNFWREK